ncbi:MAG TPA: hypothetical protein VM943_13625 [Pyrinomonadaceae bacterium]|nr:hypothetical protein [Pyrinomonadaceae bacterium]
MQNLTFQPPAAQNTPLNLADEIAQLETLLAERRIELSTLREEFQSFKARYTQIVGGCLAELEEVEREIRKAEARMLGVEADSKGENAGAPDNARPSTAAPGKTTLRTLFWSVARLFHPDHAADEGEARRRHTIMAEASRAYREGDIESLHTLLGDEELQSHCATAKDSADPEDLAARLTNLRDELRTVEFGIKRISRDGMYRLKLKVDEEARHGRDALAETAERIRRQIVKARRRLEHISLG